ncbi:hypothetical protein D3C77_590680 [compost metagenome]
MRFEGDCSDALFQLGIGAFGDIAAEPDHRALFHVWNVQREGTALENPPAAERLHRVFEQLWGIAAQRFLNEVEEALLLSRRHDVVQAAPDQARGIVVEQAAFGADDVQVTSVLVDYQQQIG